MTTTINDAYINALLADAAYVPKLDLTITPADLTSALESRMTLKLASYIGKNFTVVTQVGGLGSSFDATVWKDKAGKLYVSMRGTQQGVDFLVDADLTLNGNARAQVIDMVNWWLQSTTPVGQSARQVTWTFNPLAPMLMDFVSGTPVTGTGTVNVADFVGGIEVNGHSLGGYLASAFTRLFGAQAHVVHTTTFNSAGFAPGSEAAFLQLQNVIGTGYGIGRFPNRAEQTNYFAKNGINLTTNSFWFNQVGQRAQLFNEEDATQIGNHYMYKLTDALALGDAMAKLDNTLDFSGLNKIFEHGSNKTAESLEGVLDALRIMLTGDGITKTVVGDVSDSALSRINYHQNLNALMAPDAQGNPTGIFAELAGKLIFNSPPTSGASARNAFGDFLSLYYLAPFTLTSLTTGAEDLLIAAQGDIGTAWKADRDLTPAERAAGEATFSDDYLNDRAVLLTALVLQNKMDDTSGTVSGDSIAVGRNYKVQYYGGTPREGETQAPLQTIRASNTFSGGSKEQFIAFGDDGSNQIEGTGNTLGDHLFGGWGDDQVSGLGGDDYLEGNAGNDKLNGGDGDDTLMGGVGNDDLDGGSGFDLLQGGADNDSLAGGAGNDALYGADGNDDLKGNEDNDFLNGGAGADTLSGGTGNDYLFDQGGTDVSTMKGDEGNDILEVKGGTGQTMFEGGAGNDILIGGEGLNSLEGGDGDDLITGGKGYDIIKGGDGADNIDAGAGSDAITGGRGADYLQGGEGNDTYIYDSLEFGTDLIEDTSGSDVLYLMDGAVTSATYDANVMAWISGGGYEIRQYKMGSQTTLAISAPGLAQNTIYIQNWTPGKFGITLEGSEDEARKPGVTPAEVISRADNKFVDFIRNDAADGGQGNDIVRGTDLQSVLAGGVGNDLLDGRGGDDWLEGGDGNDIILTGEGKDVAYGGDGDDVIRAGYNFDISRGFYVGSGLPSLFYAGGVPAGYWLKTDAVTSEQFYYYQDGNKISIAHPELAVFDLKFERKLEVNDTYTGYMYWFNVGDASVSLEPSLTITLQIGNSEKVTRGASVRGDTVPDANLGMAMSARLELGNAKDILEATSGSQGARLWGGAGNDIIYGANNSDKLYGEADDDLLIGYGGDDELYGGAGKDELSGGAGKDELSGGAGRDFLDGGADADQLVGGYGADALYGGDGNDRLLGDAPYLKGVNWYPAGTDESKMGGDYLNGGAGDDTMWGNNGDDFMYGGTGDDAMYGGYDNDHLMGEAGADAMMGGKGDDFLDGGDNNDMLYGDENDDILKGAVGDDNLDGGEGNDILDGGDNNDVLTGADGDDILRGDDGNDVLYGDSGDKADGVDILEGGRGDDTLSGGGKSDTYVFSRGDGNDTIQDDGSDGSHNTVVFKFAASEVRKVRRNGVDLVVEFGAVAR